MRIRAVLLCPFYFIGRVASGQAIWLTYGNFSAASYVETYGLTSPITVLNA